MTTWALVPPKPKELTPAKRSRAPRLIGIASRTTCRLSSPKGISGLSSAACSDGGTRSCSRASVAFIRPARPETGSVWPILVLIEPIGSGACRPRPSFEPMAEASIGSPTGVPVPCASMKARSSSRISASR